MRWLHSSNGVLRFKFLCCNNFLINDLKIFCLQRHSKCLMIFNLFITILLVNMYYMFFLEHYSSEYHFLPVYRSFNYKIFYSIHHSTTRFRFYITYCPLENLTLPVTIVKSTKQKQNRKGFQ